MMKRNKAKDIPPNETPLSLSVTDSPARSELSTHSTTSLSSSWDPEEHQDSETQRQSPRTPSRPKTGRNPGPQPYPRIGPPYTHPFATHHLQTHPIPQIFSQVPQQSNQQQPGAHSNLRRVLSASVPTVLPIQWQLLPMYQQLHPSAYLGLLPAIQSRNGGVPLSLQGSQLTTLSGSHAVRQNVSSPSFTKAITSPKLCSPTMSSLYLPPTQHSKIILKVRNLIGDELELSLTLSTSLEDLFRKVKIYPAPFKELCQEKSLWDQDRCCLLYEGEKYFEGTLGKIGCKNGERVHLLREFSSKQNHFLILNENKSKKGVRYSHFFYLLPILGAVLFSYLFL